MYSIVAKQSAVRFGLALTLLVVIAVLFWTSSRYPALDEKAIMGGSIQLEDPLSFEAILPLQPDFPIWRKIAYTSVNWLHTNRQGMFFGLLLGSLFLTLLRYLRRVSFHGGFMNSALGMALGAPLGVCVNCAAPIARGMYAGGARAETTLAAMLSSPTLNIVVLTMLFSILPFYLAVAKIALSLTVILIVVPVICRLLPKPQLQLPEPERRKCPLPETIEVTGNETFCHAAKGFVKDYLADLWFIVRMTVPLMLLAGFLGAVVATLVPSDVLNDTNIGLVSLILTAIVGTFLPVPIAFDVVVSGALLSSGMGVGYVMVLLFTLGIFSVYSFLIIGRSISMRFALALSAVIIGLGAAAGAGADAWHKWQSKRALDLLTALPSALISTAVAAETPMVQEFRDGAHKITVTRNPYRARSPAADKPFTHLEAHHIGIDKPVEFSFKDMWPPFWEGRSISAGDIDQDGDADLVLASTEKGLYFYINDGKGRFIGKEFRLGEVRGFPIFNAALVDLNNDGWPDLFLATYRRGNFILWNDHGRYDAGRLTHVRNRDDAILSLALSFGDVDHDGDLDVALGNWAAGWYRRIPGEEARNRIVYNDGGRLSGDEFNELTGLPGETLSILLSDLNLDGHLDLLAGNDFEQPDVYYYGDGTGEFEQIRRGDGVIPFTTTTTMAVKNADLTNDGVPEIYLAQIAGRSSGVSERLKMRPIEYYCSGLERDEDKRICQKNMDIKTWYKSGNNFDPTFAHKCLELDPVYQAECKGMLVKDLAIQGDDPSICDLIPVDQPRALDFCRIHFLPIRKPAPDELSNTYPQIKRRNVLLVRRSDGTYEDQSVARGLDVGGWSWDTKIADFDNDEWQDVYIVNGTWVPNEVTPSNLYFANGGDGIFSEQSGPFGLEDYLITAAATVLDIEQDGDLDIVTIPVNGPVQAFINNVQSGNAIGIELRDHVGNHFSIGTRVEISYGDNGARRQMREVQSGGGFQSFDAPGLHFGLGDYDQVQAISIHWADGGKSNIEMPLAAGASYVIERNKI